MVAEATLSRSTLVAGAIMRSARRRRPPGPLAGLVALLVASVAAPVAGAATQTLSTYVESYPVAQLAVGARGDALAAWSKDDDLVPRQRSDTAAMVFASVRRPGQRFARARRVSDPGAGMRTFAIAVGARGDGAVVWQPDTVAAAHLRVRLLRRRGGFGASIALPGSVAGGDPVAAIDPQGRLLVAWLRPGRDGCGRLVMAIVVARSGRPGRPRRVSERCAHATLVRAALARDGTGAVAWRSEGSRSAHSNSLVRVSPFAGGRLRAPRTVSGAPRIGATLALAAGGHRLVAVWRDGGAGRRGIRGRVLVAAIRGRRIARPLTVSSSARPMLGDVRAAMNAHDAAIVGWAQARHLEYEPYTSSHVAIRRGARGRFAAPTTLVRNLDPHELGVALDRSGRAVAVYAGDLMRRRGLVGPWQRTVDLERADEQDDEDVDVGFSAYSAVGVSDAGDVLVIWSLVFDQGQDIRARVLPRPA
jgi:hypothetical protein